jgi:hypothetical protein
VISPLRFAMTSPHQVVKGTFTLKLSNMLGTHKALDRSQGLSAWAVDGAKHCV